MSDNNYTLNNNETEAKRLSLQANMLYGGPHFLDKYIKEDIKVADIGCGMGDIAKYVAKQIGRGSIIAIDIDKEKITLNDDELVKDNTDNICYKTGDVYNIDLPDETFDLTYARFLLMHLTNPKEAISEMYRITKKGGTVVIHEGIHDAIWLTPEQNNFNKILNCWKKLMNSKCQDHSIGLKLHQNFIEAGFNKVKIDIVPHVCEYGDPVFDVYMQNWKQHLPSLKESLVEQLNPDIYDAAEEELTKLDKRCSYVELTGIVRGVR